MSGGYAALLARESAFIEGAEVSEIPEVRPISGGKNDDVNRFLGDLLSRGLLVRARTLET